MLFKRRISVSFKNPIKQTYMYNAYKNCAVLKVTEIGTTAL
jgi:hypothetical protein